MTEFMAPAALWAAALGFGFSAVGLLFVIVRLLSADRQAYQANQSLYGKGSIFALLMNSIKGRAAIRDGDDDHYRVHRGVAYNLETDELEPQGRPSTEAIRSVHERMR